MKGIRFKERRKFYASLSNGIGPAKQKAVRAALFQGLADRHRRPHVIIGSGIDPIPFVAAKIGIDDRVPGPAQQIIVVVGQLLPCRVDLIGLGKGIPVAGECPSVPLAGERNGRRFFPTAWDLPAALRAPVPPAKKGVRSVARRKVGQEVPGPNARL